MWMDGKTRYGYPFSPAGSITSMQSQSKLGSAEVDQLILKFTYIGDRNTIAKTVLKIKSTNVWNTP